LRGEHRRGGHRPIGRDQANVETAVILDSGGDACEPKP
jgi:hypothetical protein